MTRGRTNADRERKRGRKPKPPSHLSDAESSIWTRICASQDPAWCELAATSSLLERYCIARAYSDLLVAKRRSIMATPEPGEGVAADISAAFGISEEIIKQGAELLRLERALRLTPQSRIEPKGAKNDPPEPWGDLGGDGDTG